LFTKMSRILLLLAARTGPETISMLVFFRADLGGFDP
jgi:hypothetical protein